MPATRHERAYSDCLMCLPAPFSPQLGDQVLNGQAPPQSASISPAIGKLGVSVLVPHAKRLRSTLLLRSDGVDVGCVSREGHMSRILAPPSATEWQLFLLADTPRCIQWLSCGSFDGTFPRVICICGRPEQRGMRRWGALRSRIEKASVCCKSNCIRRSPPVKVSSSRGRCLSLIFSLLLHALIVVLKSSRKVSVYLFYSRAICQV